MQHLRHLCFKLERLFEKKKKKSWMRCMIYSEGAIRVLRLCTQHPVDVMFHPAPYQVLKCDHLYLYFSSRFHGVMRKISALDTTVLHCRPRVKRLTYSYSNCGYDRKCLSLYVSRMEGGPKTLL